MKSSHVCTRAVLASLACFTSASAQDAVVASPYTLGGEFRGRWERSLHQDFEKNQSASAFLNRIRLHGSWSPRPGFTLFAEAQDARAFGWRQELDGSGLADHADLRQLYLRLGSDGPGWTLQAGRQDLSLGDERLIGADSAWDPLGRGWDAFRASYRKGDWGLTTFAGWHIEPDWRNVNRSDTGDRLYGVSLKLPSRLKGLELEPYFLIDGLRRYNNSGSRTVHTWGARALGQLARFSYNTEIAAQSGHFGALPHHAWAGHWEAAYQLPGDDRAPEIALEYNYASGDSNPADLSHTTFDDLHPAGFNKFGMADPFGWRNTRNLGAGLSWTLPKQWALAASFRWFRLASPADGLYLAGETVLTESPASASPDVGRQALLGLSRTFHQRYRLECGIARFFPGAYMLDSGFHGPLTTPYISLGYRF